MSWQIILLSRGFFLLLMKAQITRGIESLHIFSLLFPSTLQILIYFSLLPFHFIVIPGSKVFFLPSALLQQLEMTGVLHSIIPICFCISMLSHFQPQIFYYLNYCFLWHFGEKKFGLGPNSVEVQLPWSVEFVVWGSTFTILIEMSIQSSSEEKPFLLAGILGICWQILESTTGKEQKLISVVAVCGILKLLTFYISDTCSYGTS